MLTYPFEILKKRLGEEVPELREIDLYMDQDSKKNKNADLKAMPALFIEFKPFATNDMALRLQNAAVEFDCILLTDNVYDTGSKRLKLDKPTDHMKIFDKIFTALSGFSSRISYLDAFEELEGTRNDFRVMNSISRRSITPPQQYRKAQMRSVQRFQCIMYDHAFMMTLNPPVIPPGIEIEIELPIRVTADQDTITVDSTIVTSDSI